MEGLLNNETNTVEIHSLKKQKLRQFHLQSQHVLDELMKVYKKKITKIIINFVLRIWI